MTTRVAESLLSRLSACIAEQLGLCFPRARWSELARGVAMASRDLGWEDIDACIQWLTSSPLTQSQIEILARHLTVGETYFFREPRSFDVLAAHILPAFVRARRGKAQYLRFWSAGCCTGEEPYSIAILLGQELPDVQNWEVTIVATEINTHFLQKAAKGLYNAWSFRATPPEIKERYFTKAEAGQWAILPRIKNMVQFSLLNLAEHGYPSPWTNTHAMDVIFCRNVLMYLTPQCAQSILHRFYHALVDGGWLIVSPSDTLYQLSVPFTTVHFPGVMLYRKDTQDARTNRAYLPKEVPFSIRQNETMGSLLPQSAWGDVPGRAVTLPQCASHAAGEAPEPACTEAAGMVESQGEAYREALALYEQGCYGEVVETLLERFTFQQPAHHTFPLDGKVYALLARAYANRGQLAEALAWCDKAVAADKLNHGFHYLRAMILQGQGQLEEAARSLVRTLYLDQNCALAHFTLGHLTRQQGKGQEAMKHFAHALALLRIQCSDTLLLEAEGLTAGRLTDIIHALTDGELFR